jgi:hypothetical protein
MSWFKVDDGFYSHEKVLTIPRAIRAEAVGTWTLCGTWSADKDRDGYVPTHMIEELGASLAGAAALVDAKLWRRQRTGFVFVNWAEFQPTREEKSEKRRAESQRKAEYRARKARESAAVSGNVPTGQNQDDAPPVPDPTRPDPSLISTSDEVEKMTRKRATRIPEPFILTAAMRADMAAECPGIDLDHSTKQFVDYWRAASGRTATKKDWVAAWRFWIRRDAEQAGRNAVRPLTRTEQNMSVVARIAAQEAQQQKGLTA